MTKRKAPPFDLVVYRWGPPDKHWTRAEFDAAVSANGKRLTELCRDVQADFGPMGAMQMLVQAAGYLSRIEGIPVTTLLDEIRMTLLDQFDFDLDEQEAADANS
jgi:hypothetical protein